MLYKKAVLLGVEEISQNLRKISSHMDLRKIKRSPISKYGTIIKSKKIF